MSVRAKTMMFLVFLLVGFASCSGQTQKIQSNFHHEESCAGAGGYCVLENECHHPVDGEHKGLCPMQRNEGAVCCKDFPTSDVNCYQLHNECTDSYCPMHLGKRGCADNKLCCILI